MISFLEKDGEELEKDMKMMLSIPVGHQEDGSPLFPPSPEMLLCPHELLHLLFKLEGVLKASRLTGLQLIQQHRQIWELAGYNIHEYKDFFYSQ
jgi:hypothetical protein